MHLIKYIISNSYMSTSLYYCLILSFQHTAVMQCVITPHSPCYIVNFDVVPGSTICFYHPYISLITFIILTFSLFVFFNRSHGICSTPTRPLIIHRITCYHPFLMFWFMTAINISILIISLKLNIELHSQ